MATQNFTEPAERLGFIGVASTIGLLSTMVLMVAAANLGNLVMSRATSRARELGVRVALGAGRSRIVRQLAIETLPLGAGRCGRRAAVGDLGDEHDRGDRPGCRRIWTSRRTARPSCSASILTALALAMVGALPAWKISKQDLTDAIKDGGQQVSMRLDRARVRSLMLAAQVGGSCLILIVSAMMVRSLQNALTADLGFNYEQSVVLQAGLARDRHQGRCGAIVLDDGQGACRRQSRKRARPRSALAPPFAGRASQRLSRGATASGCRRIASIPSIFGCWIFRSLPGGRSSR